MTTPPTNEDLARELAELRRERARERRNLRLVTMAAAIIGVTLAVAVWSTSEAGTIDWADKSMGEVIAATDFNEIKAAVNDNDARITALETATPALAFSSDILPGPHSTGGSLIPVTAMPATITTTGGPVLVGLVPAATGDASITCQAAASPVGACDFVITRNGTEIGRREMVEYDTTVTITPGGEIWMVDPNPPAGQHQYGLSVQSNTDKSVSITSMRLIAVEL